MKEYCQIWKQTCRKEPPGPRRWGQILHEWTRTAFRQMGQGLMGLVAGTLLAAPIMMATFWSLHHTTLQQLDRQIAATSKRPAANIHFLDKRLHTWSQQLEAHSPTFRKLWRQIENSSLPVYVGTFQQLDLWQRNRAVGRALHFHPRDPWSQLKARLLERADYGLIGVNLAYIQSDFRQARQQWPRYRTLLDTLQHHETLSILGHEVAHIAEIAHQEGEISSAQTPCPDPPYGYHAYRGCSSRMESKIRAEARLGPNPLYGYDGALHELVQHLFRAGRLKEGRDVYLATFGFPTVLPGISVEAPSTTPGKP